MTSSGRTRETENLPPVHMMVGKAPHPPVSSHLTDSYKSYCSKRKCCGRGMRCTSSHFEQVRRESHHATLRIVPTLTPTSSLLLSTVQNGRGPGNEARQSCVFKMFTLSYNTTMRARGKDTTQLLSNICMCCHFSPSQPTTS